MMKIIGQNDPHQLHRIPVDLPKKNGNLDYYLQLSSRKEILRTIEEYIGDIRWRLLIIKGVNIIEVTPFTIRIFRKGMTKVFPPSFDLNLLKGYDHHGDILQYPINATFPPEKDSEE